MAKLNDCVHCRKWICQEVDGQASLAVNCSSAAGLSAPRCPGGPTSILNSQNLSLEFQVYTHTHTHKEQLTDFDGPHIPGKQSLPLTQTLSWYKGQTEEETLKGLKGNSKRVKVIMRNYACRLDSLHGQEKFT